MNNQKLNNILKDPNTNWKYIAIVAVVGLIALSGILVYQHFWPSPVQLLETPMTEQETPEETPDEESETIDGPYVKVLSPNGGEVVQQHSCQVQWESEDIPLVEIFLIAYDKDKNELVCYHSVGASEHLSSYGTREIRILTFKKAVKAEEERRAVSFQSALGSCTFVRDPKYYKIKLRDGAWKVSDVSNGYFTFLSNPEFRTISTGDEIELQGALEPSSWANHTFSLEGDAILTDANTGFYLGRTERLERTRREETSISELKQLYDEMGEKKHCPFGNCPFNLVRGTIRQISLQGKMTIIAEEMFFSYGQ